MTSMSLIKATKVADAIMSAARRNPNITSAGLRDEVARGDISGWMSLDAVRNSNFSEWSGGMEKAAADLQRLEEQKARAIARRAGAPA